MQIQTKVGFISCIDKDTGRVNVIYKDRNNATTSMLPFLNINNEYQKPQIDEKVIVLYITKSTAIVLGGIMLDKKFNKNLLYRKDFDSKCSKDYFEQLTNDSYEKKIGDFDVKYDKPSKTLEINVDKIVLKTSKDTYEL